MNNKLWNECFNGQIVPINQALGAMDKYCQFLEAKLLDKTLSDKIEAAPAMPALEKVGHGLREPGGFISNANIEDMCDKLLAAADGLYNTNRMRSLEIRSVCLRLCGFKQADKPVSQGKDLHGHGRIICSGCGAIIKCMECTGHIVYDICSSCQDKGVA